MCGGGRGVGVCEGGGGSAEGGRVVGEDAALPWQRS